MVYIDDSYTKQANLEYIRTAMKTPILKPDEEKSLLKAWVGKKDEKALHKIINAHVKLVIATAAKFKHYGLPMGDLIQEGNVGLLQAAEKFDISREVRFATYAGWWIRAAIQDYVLRNWSIVRTGTTSAQKSLFFNLRRLRAKITAAQNKEDLNDDDRQKIAKKLNVKVSEVMDMEGRLSGVDSSLNATIGRADSEGGESEWISLLGDDRPDPEEIVIGLKDAESRSAWLHDALHQLSDREKHIIEERHLQDNVVTLEELGKELGISKERVRQLEHRAMEKLKTSMAKRVDRAQDLLIEA